MTDVYSIYTKSMKVPVVTTTKNGQKLTDKQLKIFHKMVVKCSLSP